jgi:rod shape-determining protein MreD
MNWVGFAVLVYLTTVVQTSVAPFLAVHSIRPDFLVIVAVFFGLYARAADAMLGCWIIGLLIDLSSLSHPVRANVGLHALTLGLLAVFMVKTRGVTFREGMVSHLIYTFVVCFLLTLAVRLHTTWDSPDWPALGRQSAVAFYTSVYTSLLAPYVHFALRRLRGLLGLHIGQHEFRK